MPTSSTITRGLNYNVPLSLSNPGSLALSILNAGRLLDIELQAMVPAVDIPELRPGMTVDLAVDGFGERKFGGRIERINPSTEPGTRAILVFVGVPNPNGELRGGMFSTGRVALAASAPALSLPANAVRSEAGQTFVWTIEDGKLVKRMVVVGRRDEENNRVEIKTALPASARVLAARFDNLKEGAPALVRSEVRSQVSGIRGTESSLAAR